MENKQHKQPLALGPLSSKKGKGHAILHKEAGDRRTAQLPSPWETHALRRAFLLACCLPAEPNLKWCLPPGMHTHLPSCRQWKGPSCHHRICPLTYFFPTGPQCVHPASISSKTAHRAGRETGPLFQNRNITSKKPYLYKPIIKYSPGNPKTMTSITSDHYKSTLRPQLATGPRPPRHAQAKVGGRQMSHWQLDFQFCDLCDKSALPHPTWLS